MRRAVGGLLLLALVTTACRSAAKDHAVEAARSAVVSARQAEVGFPGIFPFATRQELDAYAAGPDQVFRDPGRTARQFAVRYLGFTSNLLGVAPYQADESGAVEVPVGVHRRGEMFVATTVVVRQLGPQGPNGPWTVTAASSPRIPVDAPDPMQRVSSPVPVSGRADVFEGKVSLQVREDGMVAGQSLGDGFVTADGPGGPFRGEVEFRAPSRPAGAILFQDRSGVGVGDTEIFSTTVVRVQFGPVGRTG